MQTVRLHGPGDLRLHDEPVPTPGPGQALVRVTATGVCGSDLHWFVEGRIGDTPVTRPLVLGHESAGVIESGPQRGQRVAIDPAIPCGQCEHCQEGNPNLCTSLTFAGAAPDDGLLQEYVAWPTRCLFPLPDTLTDEDGAMLEPLGIAIHAVDLGHVKPGMTVGVFGCGPIGWLILQMARAAGATRLIATDLPNVPHRLEAARSLGATVFAAQPSHKEAAEILAATGGRGVDVAFEAAGEDEAVAAAIASVRRGARVVLAGIPADDRTTFTASTARHKGLTLKLVRRMKLTYPRAIRLVESGQVDVRTLVTHRFPFEASAEAYSAAHRREGLKIIIEGPKQ